MQHSLIHLRLPACLRAIAAATLLLGAAALPAEAASKPAKITVKSLEEHFGDVETLSASIDVKMKGTMLVEKKKLPLSGTMLMSLDIDTKNERARLNYAGDMFEKMFTSMAGRANAKQLKNFSMSMIIDRDSSFVEMAALGNMCQKVPESGDIQKLRDSFNQVSFGNDILEEGARTIEGLLVGEKVINGIATKHYKLSAATLKDMSTNANGTRYSAAEIWIATDGDYLVQLKATATGRTTPGGPSTGMSAFNGTMNMLYTLKSVNKPLTIKVPAACAGQSS
jgi:hypothetical protein